MTNADARLMRPERDTHGIGLQASSPAARRYLASMAMVGIALLAGLSLRYFEIGPENVGLVFLTAVFMSAIRHGLWPALAAVVVSALAYNFFFFPPLYTFRIAEPGNVVTVFLFGFVAIVAGNLGARVRAHAADLERARLAAETDRLRASLLTSISHDLRTPLASILGSATSLRAQRATLDEEAREELLATIQEESERLNRFIANLLDMTRLESGAIAPRLEPVEVGDVVGSALRIAGSVLSRHHVVTNLERDLPLIRLDPVLFEQVLFNLLDNASKYAPAGTRIEVAAARIGDKVRVEVLDEGAGIPAADLERIFDKFYRVNSTDRQRAGTGLGLAICRGFVEAMGGTIAAANRSGRNGAVLRIDLPVVAPQEPSA